MKIGFENQNWESKLKIKIESQIWESKFKIEIENQNWISRLEIEIENWKSYKIEIKKQTNLGLRGVGKLDTNFDIKHLS